MHTKPLFSVLIANYNNGAFIIEAIKSIQNQIFNNFEIVIVDDFSTDNSIEIIRQIQISENRIFLYQNDKNRGVGFTKKKAIDCSKGEIFAFLDPDDTITFDALEIMVNFHHQYLSASTVYSTHFICDDKLVIQSVFNKTGPIPEGKTYLQLESKDKINITAFASFKKTYYLKTKGLDVFYKKAIDKDLYYKMEEVGQTVYIDKPLYYYRHHAGSISLFNNEIKALYWELIAKTKAFKRRKKSQGLNISLHSLRAQWYNYYKICIARSLADKNTRSFLGNSFLMLIKKPKLESVKYLFYLLKKYKYPESF